MLHLAFRRIDDIETSSTGEGLRRFVVAHPQGYDKSKLAALGNQPRLPPDAADAAELRSPRCE